METFERFSSCLCFLTLTLSLLFCNTQASHHVFPDLQSLQSIPTSENQSYRTAFHFQPHKHWINDPNGPMYYNGIYHLFYQYNPYGSVWGNIVWAHSVSTDLINWTPLEPAIYPSAPFDSNGCWSGSATILPGNRPVILYTGIDQENRQVQNLAEPKDPSDPFLREWVKPKINPLMVPISGINASSFRDPTTAWQGPDGRWRVLVGSKRRGRGMAILYRSKDFKYWVKAQHPLHSAGKTGMWECPDFYPVSLSGKSGVDASVNGDFVKHVLKVSLDDKKHEYYTIGNYEYERDVFRPDDGSVDGVDGLRYDYGKFYASKTFFDNDKYRRVLWGWLNESDSVSDDVHKGWSGVQAIPRTVWLDSNGKQLVQWPIKEIETLRGQQVSLQNSELTSGQVIEISGVKATQADVEVSFELGDLEQAEPFDSSWVDPQLLCSQKGASVKGRIGPFGLMVLASQNLDEYTAVYFRVFKNQNKNVVLMCSDQSRSSLRTEVDKTTYGAFVDIELLDGKIDLRSMIDHSIVESFGAGGRTCISARVYPDKAIEDNAHLHAFNYGTANVNISRLSAWEMKQPQKMN